MVSVRVRSLLRKALPFVAIAVIAAALAPRGGAAESKAGSKTTARPASPIDCEQKDWPRSQAEADKEHECLAKLKGLVERTKGKLTLKLENGKSVTFRDEDRSCADPNSDWEACVSYGLIGFRPAERMFIVTKGYYEGHQVLLVGSRTGQTATLATSPQFSPSGKRLVSVDANTMDDRDYDIAIWSTEAAEPARLEWQYSIPQGKPYFSFEFVRWLSDDRIELRAEGKDGIAVEVVHKDGGWQVVD